MIVGGGLLAFAGVLIYQILHIQLAEGERWKELSEQMSHTYLDIPAVRGNIYAADGSLLATSVPRYDVRFDTRAVHQDTFRRYVHALSAQLASKIGARSYPQYVSWLTTARKKGERYLLLGRKLNYLDIMEMREWPIFRLGPYAGGFIVEEETIRTQPFGSLAQRTIGFYKPGIGGVGIERASNNILSGVNGKRLVQRISGGYRPMNDENAIDPVQGRDVYTSINIEYQDAAESALRKSLELNQAEYGCAIVMEVSTGRIKAISNLSRLPDGTYQERFNYAMGAGFEPGSTFKLVSALALLEDEKNKPEDSVEIFGGKYRYYNALMEDSETGLHDKLTFSEVIEKSSNVGISRLVYEAYKNKPSDFLAYLNKLHLDRPLGIELPGEPIPVVKKPGARNWYGTTLPWMSIGYEMSLTPLHILTLYNAVANEGRMMKPSIITGYGSTGVMKESIDAEVLVKEICSDETLEELKKMLEGVVSRGTAKNLAQLEFKVAGKTGTSLIAAANKGYEDKYYNASFVGYFPAEAPKYSCFVLVSKPTRGVYYGGAVAAPVFKEIAQKIYAREMRKELDVLPDRKSLNTGLLCAEELRQWSEVMNYRVNYSADNKQSFWAQVKLIGNTLTVSPAVAKGNTLPDLSGMGLSDAQYLLENKGYKVRFTGHGKVQKQIPEAGTSVEKGQIVWIYLGKS